MKRLTILFAALGLLVGLPTVASAQTSTATVTINASVVPVCRFTSGQTGNTLNFGVLDQSNATDMSLSTNAIKYQCTVGTPAYFKFASASGASSPTKSAAPALSGFLVDTTDPTKKIGVNYQGTYGGNGTGLGAGQDKTFGFTATIPGANKQNAPIGTYADTVTISIEL